MSILASLVRAYDRLPDAPPFGYSAEKIGFLISLNCDGSVAHVVDLRGDEGKRKTPKMVMVPQPVKRTAGIAPNFLWDKTSYVLGITAGEGKRTADEHAAFLKRHADALESQPDEGLAALAAFLRNWRIEQFAPPVWPDDMKDQNVVFCLERDRLQNILLHDRPAARALWSRIAGADQADSQICLVTGESGPVARLHPSVKGVWGAQSSGAAIVSFNLDAFKSYGHEQGDNAPVSEAAAFAYTAALNRFLERDSGHRIQIGDASTVFWADAPELEPELASDAEAMFLDMVSPADNAKAAVKSINEKLEAIRAGKRLRDVEPKLGDVRFHVLGLAPNAARLSIRFYFEDSFGVLTENYQRYLQDMALEPGPREPYPALWRYLVELAVLGKREHVPPNLAGEWMRSILTGTRYPLTLLSAVLGRIRADGEVNALRVGIMRALLVRNFDREPGIGDKEREAPVAFDPENRSKGYLLGRLFAVYEQAQSAALGRNVNSTIKDKFYSSASATPRNVFPLLDRGSVNHLSKVGKERPGQRVNLEKAIGGIMEMMSPGGDPFPASLSSEEQAMFGLGYHHQRGEFFRKRDTTTEEATP